MEATETRKGNRLQFNLDNILSDNNEINIGKLIDGNTDNLKCEIKYYDEKNELNDLINESTNYRMARLHSKDLLNSVNFLKINDVTYNEYNFNELTKEASMKDIIDFGYFDINLKDTIISLKSNKGATLTFFVTTKN
jgi:hypothetical protein